MFALKIANVTGNFANIFKSIRWKPITKNIVTTVLNHQNNKEYFYPHIKALFPYMKAEMENGTEYMPVLPGKIVTNIKSLLPRLAASLSAEAPPPAKRQNTFRRGCLAKCNEIPSQSNRNYLMTTFHHISFLQLSDVIREFIDYSKFILRPNSFKQTEEHLIKVRFSGDELIFVFLNSFVCIAFFLIKQCRCWTTICQVDIEII